MAIKRITAANENRVTGRSRAEAQHYWAETHGRLVANSPSLQHYHHYFSLHEAYQNEPKPTLIGISMFWRDNPLIRPAGDAEELDTFTRFYRNQPLGSDDRQLFDREKRWPVHDQHVDILGEEHVIVHGETKPSMVNAIFRSGESRVSITATSSTTGSTCTVELPPDFRGCAATFNVTSCSKALLPGRARMTGGPSSGSKTTSPLSARPGDLSGRLWRRTAPRCSRLKRRRHRARVRPEGRIVAAL